MYAAIFNRKNKNQILIMFIIGDSKSLQDAGFFLFAATHQLNLVRTGCDYATMSGTTFCLDASSTPSGDCTRLKT